MPQTLPVSYSSVAHVYETLPDLGSATTLTSAHIASFIGKAEALVNAAIARAYSLPLPSVPPLLTALSTDIAIYLILSQRMFSAERLNSSPWPDRYKEALATLDRLASGDLILVDASGSLLGGRTDVAEVYCLAPDTRVLTSDLRWVPVGQCAIGDRLLAFDEDISNVRAHRKLRYAVVTSIDKITQPCCRVRLTDGRVIVASTKHLWLTRQPGNNLFQWVATRDLRPGKSRIRDLGRPWETDESYEAGYLAGIFDGEGSFSIGKPRHGFRIHFSQRPGLVMDLTREFLGRRGFQVSAIRHHRSGVQAFELLGLYNCLRFLGALRPIRLLARAEQWLTGKSPRTYEKHAVVSALDYIGEQEVVAIGTSTRTLFAEGLFSHNSTTKGYEPSTHEGPWTLQIQDPDKIQAELERRGLLR